MAGAILCASARKSATGSVYRTMRSGKRSSWPRSRIAVGSLSSTGVPLPSSDDFSRRTIERYGHIKIGERA